MGSLSIQKGKRAERTVANALNPILDKLVSSLGCDPVKLKRNLAQTQQGGFDLEGLPWIAIEIKHHQQVSLGAWWAQTLRQAGDQREPVLIWKKHGGQWNVRMYARLEIEPGRRLKVVADITWEAFLIWFEKRAEVELRAGVEQALIGGPGLF
jgi:hypothetical protein